MKRTNLTDNASFEEEAQVAGTVLDVFFDNGDEIPVLTNVMVIGNEGESTDEFRPGGAAAAEVAAPAVPAAATVAPAEVKTTAPAPAAAPAAAPSGTMSPVSPRAKALAEKEAVNAAALTGTGPHGRVIERDVKAAAEAAPKTTPLAKAIIKETGAALPTAGSGLAGMAKGADVGALKNSVYATDSEIKPISNMRKIIAKAMHASLQNSAQLTHHLSADARRIMALRKKVKKAVENGYPTNITLNDMVCMAVIKALKKFPQVNAHFLGDSTRNFSKVHLGLAVDTERGLMVPTVKNADDLSIQGLASQLKEVAEACKKGSIGSALFGSRFVHRIESRQLRRRDLYPGHQSAAGCDPRREHDRSASERPRRRSLRFRSAHRTEPYLRSPRAGRRRSDPFRETDRHGDRKPRIRIVKPTGLRNATAGVSEFIT